MYVGFYASNIYPHTIVISLFHNMDACLMSCVTELSWAPRAVDQQSTYISSTFIGCFCIINNQHLLLLRWTVEWQSLNTLQVEIILMVISRAMLMFQSRLLWNWWHWWSSVKQSHFFKSGYLDPLASPKSEIRIDYWLSAQTFSCNHLHVISVWWLNCLPGNLHDWIFSICTFESLYLCCLYPFIFVSLYLCIFLPCCIFAVLCHLLWTSYFSSFDAIKT